MTTQYKLLLNDVCTFKPVKNKELWIELDDLIARHNITWEWVKGHAGNTHNEKADYLARRYIEEV